MSLQKVRHTKQSDRLMGFEKQNSDRGGDPVVKLCDRLSDKVSDKVSKSLRKYTQGVMAG